MSEGRHSIHDIGYKNINDENIANRTKKNNKLSWLYFTKSWSNEKHCDEIYVGDIFDNDSFLNRIKNHVLPEKSYKKFTKALYSAVWGEFYGRYQYETTITTWPVHIYGDKLAPLFEKAMEEGSIDLDDGIPGEKVSVGDIIFLNWTPFAEYVWNNRDILTKMLNEK